jgi:hypothetical protein
VEKKKAEFGWKKPKTNTIEGLGILVEAIAQTELDNLQNKLERIKHVLETVKSHKSGK